MNQEPVISINCITYNHAPYVRQCIEGFLMQETSFPFEILIHDDASTDGTQDIIREYQQKYPEIVKPCLQTENQYSKGKGFIGLEINFDRAKGKYVAICEGDDYWIDKHKLQRQFDALESSPDCSICYSAFETVDEAGERVRIPYYEQLIQDSRSGDILSLLFYHNFILTPSVCVRREVFQGCKESGSFIDYSIFLSAAIIGKAIFMKDALVAYRKHSSGMSTSNLSSVKVMCRDVFAYWENQFWKSLPRRIKPIDWLKTAKVLLWKYCHQDENEKAKIHLPMYVKCILPFYSFFLALRERLFKNQG